MRFITEDRGAPKSAGSIAVATFGTIVNPTLTWIPHAHRKTM